MKKNLFAAIAVIAVGALAAPSLSQAQFGNLLSAAKLPSSSGNSAGADVGAQQDSLVRSYLAAGNDVSVANRHLSDALGIKTSAVNDAATSGSLSANDIAEKDKAISENAAKVSEGLKAGATLKDNAAKATFAKGILSLATGVKKYADMRNDVQGFSSSLSGASPMQLPKLQAGVYVAKNMPTSLANLTTVLKSAVEFGKSNGVEIPKDATSLL